jgi:hypothetical protein
MGAETYSPSVLVKKMRATGVSLDGDQTRREEIHEKRSRVTFQANPK